MLFFMTKKQKETMDAIRKQHSLKCRGGVFSLDAEEVKERCCSLFSLTSILNQN